jgi:CheY-like chemotaxis protein
VLVVEDDPDSQAYMKKVLERSYEVILAGSADEARRKLAVDGKRIRLVLMDVALHGGDDGFTLTRSLRKDPRWKNVPIIATTALALPEDRIRAYDAGCTAYLPKPMARHALLRLMSQLLSALPSPPAAASP